MQSKSQAKSCKTYLTGNSDPIALGRSDLGHRSVGHVCGIGDGSRGRLGGHLPSALKGDALQVVQKIKCGKRLGDIRLGRQETNTRDRELCTGTTSADVTYRYTR